VLAGVAYVTVNDPVATVVEPDTALTPVRRAGKDRS
jgi:hypothetical protein